MAMIRREGTLESSTNLLAYKPSSNTIPRCEGENSLEPQVHISLNYGAKEYLASLPSFYELHASLLEFIGVLEISLVLRDV
jgi:hypothetical protein